MSILVGRAYTEMTAIVRAQFAMLAADVSLIVDPQIVLVDGACGLENGAKDALG